MLADHPALNFMNAVVRMNGELVDFLQTDDDIPRWVACAGWPVDKSAAKYYPDILLEVGLGLSAAI